MSADAVMSLPKFTMVIHDRMFVLKRADKMETVFSEIGKLLYMILSNINLL